MQTTHYFIIAIGWIINDLFSSYANKVNHEEIKDVNITITGDV